MSSNRHVAAATITFGVTLGAGLVAEHRDAIDDFLALGDGARAASASAAVAPPAALALSDPSRLPALVTEVAGPLTLAALAPRAKPEGAAPADPVAGLTDVVPVAFETDQLMGEGVLLAPAPAFASAADALPDALPGLAGGCRLSAVATPAPAAMIDLAIDAPCAAGQALTIHHEGLMVRILADAEGRADLSLPALAATAVVMVEDASGAAAVATALVPDLVLYDRAVLQWQGAAGPEMHAREFGAAYGEPGDVWAGAPREAALALAGGGGFLVALGDPTLPAPMLAEVYTFPSGVSRQGGMVDLTVEAQVSEATCGREVAAQTIQVSGDAPAFASDLALPMPGCEAVGEWIVLDELLLDLTVAAL